MRYETNSDNLTIQNTENGYLSKVKLEGRTLVNLLGSQAKNRITLNSTSKSKLYQLIQPIQANKDIFIRVSVTGKKAPINGLKINVQNEDGTFDYFNGFTGVYDQSIKIRHTKNITHLGFYMPQGEFDTDSTAFITFEKAQVTLKDIGTNYIEGLKSVGDGTDKIVVSSVDGDGNLFDGEFIPNKVINGDSGNILDSNERCITKNRIFVRKGDKIYFKITSSQTGGTIKIREVYFYDKGGSYLGRQGSYITDSILTVNFEGYMQLSIMFATSNIEDLVDISKIDLTIVRSDKAITNVLPHKQDKKQLLYLDSKDNAWKKPILREWDTVEKHSDGKYYYHKRTESLSADGNTVLNVIQPEEGDLNTRVWMNTNNTIKPYTPTICDKINDKGTNVRNQNTIAVDAKGNIVIGILNTQLETPDRVGISKWLQNNNINFVAQLAQEEVYECTPISVASHKGDTIYQIESGAISPTSSFELDYTLSNAVARVSDAKVFNQAMADNLRQNLINKGVEVTSEDKMSSLIDKVKSIELGKKWASGDSTPTGSGYNYFINVNNLEFTPKTIFIYGGKGSYYHFNFFTNEIVPSVADGPVLSGFYYGESSVKLYNNSNITINDNSFSAKILNIATQFTNGNYTWLAIE